MNAECSCVSGVLGYRYAAHSIKYVRSLSDILATFDALNRFTIDCCLLKYGKAIIRNISIYSSSSIFFLG